MNNRSSSLLIHLRILLTALIQLGFVTSGSNATYNSNPTVIWNEKRKKIQILDLY